MKYMRIGEKKNQEMDAILLIIGIVYGVCRIGKLPSIYYFLASK
jgi:hypothetical protein